MIFKNKTFENKELKTLIYSLIFLTLILSTVILLRESQAKPYFAAGESYYNLRISQEIRQDPFYDTDLIQQTPYNKDPYHFVIAFLLNRGMPVILIPLLFGLIFGIAFYILLLQLGFAYKNAAFSVLLLGITPVFIILFTGLWKLSFVVLLSILAANFFFSKNYWAYPWKLSGKLSFISSMLILTILSLTSFFAFIITVFFLFLLSLYSSKNTKSVVLVTTPSILVIGANLIFNNYFITAKNSMDFQEFSLKEIFSVLGSSLGIDIFMLLFFFIGLVILWSHFSQTRLYHLLALLFIIGSFFSPTLRVYSSLIIIIYCVVALKHLYYRKWELEVIQSGTVLLLACALVFSALNQITLLVNSEPSVESLSALDTLKYYPQGVVLSQKELSSSVQFFSEKKTLLSEKNNHQGLNDYLLLLDSSRLTDARLLLEKNQIRYFLITPQMKESFWDNKETGLLFLIHHSDSFIKRYDWKGYEIWEYFEKEKILG